MKLNDILKILDENILQLDFQAKLGTVEKQNVFEFIGLNTYRSAIDNIDKTGLLGEEIIKLRATPVFTTFKDKITINSSEAYPIIALKDEIRKIAGGIFASLNSISIKHKEHSILIKLPKINDFGDLAKVSDEIQKLLSQSIINPHIKGVIQIQGVENGSIWLEVYLGTSAALSLIASLTWSSMVIYKKMQEGKILHQQVQSLKIKNESLKEIQKAQKEQLDLVIDAEANSLYLEHFGKSDPEQIERLKLSIKTLSELINKGAEVHPALNTPESVANLFPDKNNLALVESRIKQIENK